MLYDPRAWDLPMHPFSLLCHRSRLWRTGVSQMRMRQWLKYFHDSLAQSMWLDGLRHLFDDSQLLAVDPSPRRLLALAQTFPISCSAAAVGCHVDHSWMVHGTMATRGPLHHALGMAPRDRSILDRPLDLLTSCKTIQHCTTTGTS